VSAPGLKEFADRGTVGVGSIVSVELLHAGPKGIKIKKLTKMLNARARIALRNGVAKAGHS